MQNPSVIAEVFFVFSNHQSHYHNANTIPEDEKQVLLFLKQQCYIFSSVVLVNSFCTSPVLSVVAGSNNKM